MSYLEDCTFATKLGTAIFPLYIIKSGVPRSAISSPFNIFNIQTADQPITINTHVADYADDKV